MTRRRRSDFGVVRTQLASRFWAKVDKTDSCWLWTAGKFGTGYGAIVVSRKVEKAHRISWELAHGPVPDGLYVLHKCDVRSCVNPEHLFLGSQGDNIRDAVSKGRHVAPALAGERNPSARLTAQQVQAIRESTDTGVVLSRRFGISRSTVSSVRRQQSWRNAV